jgi:glycosyltransferase involved in cell wall biosynthesis
MKSPDQNNIPPAPRYEEQTVLETAPRLEGGLRTRGQGLRRPVGRGPVISVVTVVRNGGPLLERTIQSILDQTYDAVELIIIDGGSTDGTLDIIRRYDPKIDYWMSEPDKGIYDAMNKGIDLATGAWICFLNAGDEFFHRETVFQLVPELRDDRDVLFGRHEEIFGDCYARTPALGDLRDLWKGMAFSHQSMLVRTPIMKSMKFNISNRIVADYEFIFTLYAQKHRFHAVNRVISRVIADGFSATNNIELIRQQWRIAKRFTTSPLTVDVYYLGSLASVAFKNMVKRLFPRRMVNRLRSRSWR